MADTRKDKRAPVSLKVRFKSATVDEFIEHYSKDVSRGGIYIKSSQPMPVGTLLKFQFQLKDESALIKGVGRVVWTRTEDRAAADRPAGMGIKFIKMDPESRAMVDRIVESHAGGPGAFEEGRSANGLPDSEAPPPAAAENSGFFPDVGPAQLPPPEDRTAVRQAAEFLAAALSEVKDEDAAREAEKKAAEARERTAQIEAQRIAEAERQKREADALPSMIIDPVLSMPPPAQGAASSAPPAQGAASSAPPPADAPRAAPDEEIPTVSGHKPKGPSLPPPAAKAQAAASSTPPAPKPEPASPPAPAAPSAPAHSLETTTQLAPALNAPSSRRSPFLPIAAIVAVLAVAGFVALRGGPNDRASDVTPAAAAPEETPSTVGANPPEPEPAAEAEQPEPAAEENAAAKDAPGEEEVPLFEPDPEPPEMVAIKVSTQPTGAEISVNGEVKGTSPLTLQLEKGAAVTLSAALRGYAAASLDVTPTTAKSHKLLLNPLPYVLQVDTTPPGATVSGAGKRGTAPAELSWPRAPGSVFKVTAKLAGYEASETLVDPASFEEREDAMRAAVQLSLNPLPEKPQSAPKEPKPKPAEPKPVAKPSEPADSEGAASASAADTAPQAEPRAPAEKPQAEPAAEPEPAKKPEAEPKPEPAPAPKPETPAPEAAPAQKPAPKPDEALPENPFG